MNSPFLSLITFFLFIHFSFAQINPEKIEIIRDSFGVPHIYANTDQEVAYGLAWAHCEDNFITIQETFLPAVNKLGLHSGKDGLTMDFLVQWLKCREVAENNMQKLSPEVIKVIEGYVQGINAYAKANPKEVLVKKSFPMTLLDYLTGYNLVIHFFSDSGETLRALKKNNFEPILDTTENHVSSKSIGSNAFVFSKKITKDSLTYFNSNTHQPLEGPFSWYEAHLVSKEGWNMLGALFPGSPFPMIGTNENLGWTHTFNYPDLVDVYHLKMHPKKKNWYEVDGEWLKLEVVRTKLRLKILGMPISIRKKGFWSIYGPTMKNESGYFSFKSNALENISSIDQWYQMNKSTNFQEFQDALSICGLPRFNTMYADKNDNILYISTGRIPVRSDSYNWKKVLPGNTRKTLTNEYYSTKQLPQIINPSCGYLFNTNNSPYNATAATENLKESDFPRGLGFREKENNRSLRLMELINQDSVFDYEDFKRMKYDIQYPEKVWSPIEIDGIFKLTATDYPDFFDLISIIQSWDKRSDTLNIGAAQWSIYYDKLKKNSKTAKKSDKEKTQLEVVLKSLEETKEYLINNFGKIEIQLRDYQKHVRGNRIMAVSGLTDMIVAMNTTSFEKGMVRSIHGDSYIMLARYGNNDVLIETVLPYGQSNHENSPHYSDQMEMYVKQQRKTMSLKRMDILSGAELIYSPK